MRAIVHRMLAVLVGIPLLVWPSAAGAEESEVSISLLPVRQVFVDGDREKFRAHHWMSDTYAGGIEDFSAHHSFDSGAVFSAEGHALANQSDAGLDVSLKKEGLGFFNADYSLFRKWFDGTGGVWRRFTTLQANDTNKDLHLDIGKMGLEAGLTLEGLPTLTLQYEREFKSGAKSRLTWPSVVEVGEARKIGPAWSEVDERVDSFSVKTGHEIAGFDVHAQQSWEFVRSEVLREERALSTNATASESKIRRQDMAPEANLMTTLVGGERRFLDDKVFFAGAYRFAHIKNREFETIIETNGAGVPTSFSNPEQKRDSRADNKYNSHTWTGNSSFSPWKWLQVVASLKGEIIRRASNSIYRGDDTPNSSGGSAPDGVVDLSLASLNDSKALRLGEGVGLRFFGIPKSSLYGELEFEQSKMDLTEDRKAVLGASANDTFNRETIADVDRATYTVGGRTTPWPFLDVTSQLRHRVYKNDYDDQRETIPASSSAKSAFFDGQTIITDEASVRTTWKPLPWLRPSLRYQYRDDKYATRAEAQAIVKTESRSHIYTADLTLQPLRDLSTTLSFSRQTAATITPARYNSGVSNIPTFNANVNSTLLSADYTPEKMPNLTLSNSVLYSTAHNFNDFASYGLPYGAEFEKLDLTAGLKWSPKEGSSVGLEYGFYRYASNQNVEIGDYNAHVVWLEASKEF